MNVTIEVQEIFERWMQRANGHIAAARVLVRAAQPLTEDAACYHAHEAVVIVVKAALTMHGIVMPRIHDLEYLHRMIPEESRFPADAAALSWLSTYGIERWWDPDHAQASRALAIAEAFFDTALSWSHRVEPPS
jgi:HEPN domain-containing protein